MSSHRHKNTKSLQTGLAPSTTYWFTAVAKSTGSTWEVMIRCENCSTPDEESLHKVPKNGSEVRVFKRHPRQVGHCSALRRNDAMVNAQAAAEVRLTTGTAIHARTAAASEAYANASTSNPDQSAMEQLLLAHPCIVERDDGLYCTYCKQQFTQRDDVSEFAAVGLLISNTTQHVNGEAHGARVELVRQYGPRVLDRSAFFGVTRMALDISAIPKPGSFGRRHICQGYFDHGAVEFATIDGSVVIDCTPMLHKKFPLRGEYRADPNYPVDAVLHGGRSFSGLGSFWHGKCNGTAVDAQDNPLGQPTCTYCSSVFSVPSLREKCLEYYRSQNVAETTETPEGRTSQRLDTLASDDLLLRCRERTAQVRALEGQLWLLKQNLIRSKVRKVTLRDEILEMTKRGDASEAINLLLNLSQRGQIEARPVLFSVITDMLRSAAKRNDVTGTRSRGNSWAEATMRVFAVMKNKAGEAAMRFWRANLESPAESTVSAYWNKTARRVPLCQWLCAWCAYPSALSHRTATLAIDAAYIEGSLDVIVQAAEKKGEPFPIQFNVGIDESKMNSTVVYQDHSDCLIGCCSATGCGEGKRCDMFYSVKLGDDPETQARADKLIAEGERAEYISVALLVPCRATLPVQTGFVGVTCNRFNSEDVGAQLGAFETCLWSIADRRPDLLNKLTPFRRGERVNLATDGDARRTLYQKQMANYLPQTMSTPTFAENATDRTLRFGLTVPGFTISAIINEHGNVSGMQYQDERHLINNMYRQSNNKSRVLALGTGVISHNATVAILRHYPASEHKVGEESFAYADGMNKTVMVQMCSRSVQAVLEKAATPGSLTGKPEQTSAQLSFIRFISEMMQTVWGQKKSLLGRIESLAYGIEYLRLWRLSARRDKTISTRFFTSQTYGHAIMQWQTQIIHILASRGCPDQKVYLEEVTTNHNEDLFAGLGGWTGLLVGRRNFNIGQALDSMERLNSQNEFAVDKDIQLNFRSKAGRKREMDMGDHEDSSLPDAELTPNFADSAAIDAWKRGRTRGQDAAVRDGLFVRDELPSEPWIEEEAHMKLMPVEEEGTSDTSTAASTTAAPPTEPTVLSPHRQIPHEYYLKQRPKQQQ